RGRRARLRGRAPRRLRRRDARRARRARLGRPRGAGRAAPARAPVRGPHDRPRRPPPRRMNDVPRRGAIHHVELWVPDLPRAVGSWGWLLGERGYRRLPGLNHLALHAGSRAQVDTLAAAAPRYGWTLLCADRHPYAGGPDHYAACLED